MNRTFPIFAAIAAISAIVIVAGSWAPFKKQPNETVDLSNKDQVAAFHVRTFSPISG